MRLCRGNFDGSEVVAAANAAAAASAASEASSSCSSPSSSAAAFVAASGDETVLSVGGLRLGLAPTPATYTSLITAYGRAGRPADAIAAFEDARARGCERNAVVFASLASALERCSSISSGTARSRPCSGAASEARSRRSS